MNRMNQATLTQREKMVTEQIEARGITDSRVIAAMRELPRERFAGPDNDGMAYQDRWLPIAEGQILQPPYVVALMCAAAEIAPNNRVLEIGAGSGYGAAVLSRLAHRVWTMESNPKLARYAGARIAELGLSNVTVLRADGAGGWPPAAPFDAIVVSGAGDPDILKRQLVIGGRLIMALEQPDGAQQVVKIVRVAEGQFSQETLTEVTFAP